MGSSPLARGIYKHEETAEVAQGIIPARAGNITPATSPRSAMAGSSPLARGIFNLEVDVHAHSGIIPARAGNICHQITQTIHSGDHPRSRGEYLKTLTQLFMAAGSSPLARGI